MTENLLTSYKRLMERTKEIMVFVSTESIMQWDMETKMPPKGIHLRSEQLALLSGMQHKMETAPEIGALLRTIENHKDYETLDTVQKRNVYLIRKNYDEQTKLPEDLVKEMAKQHAIAVDVWKKAKAAKKFSVFRPELEKNIELSKKAAEILMKVKKTAIPYDALVDIFEPKMTTKEIARVFNELREGLVSLLKKCESSPKQPDVSFLSRRVPTDVQRALAVALAETVQYDVSSKNAGGRIDETEHPFTNGYFDDVRITTHYYEKMFASSVFSILHEAGHALYEQGLNRKWMYQPVGTACSSGFHESQSRFVENIIGRSREFWVYFMPKLKKLTGKTLSDVSVDKFVHAVNQVKPSKIRVEADEVTYGLHIIVRFNIERDLFADKITTKELPEVWNQSYEDYLCLKIKNDSEGVMQDTHWASGYYGYFPSYALGNIYDGQLLEAMAKDVPNGAKQVEKGRFTEVRQWLVKNVHSQGDLYDPPDLIKRISGKELTVKPYLRYLNAKYSKLYDF